MRQQRDLMTRASSSPGLCSQVSYLLTTCFGTKSLKKKQQLSVPQFPCLKHGATPCLSRAQGAGGGRRTTRTPMLAEAFVFQDRSQS